ncbi:class E basic helix-loop-helix protein 41 [Sphaerodactylus townsendi]|uniref:Class E basic helix-loop-helix protein 41 n=1 Tax=Sphaerodactylus townsendi TaxID=933632 RepID=A0ACB8FQ01_9SAUR|nr:class E basic helix-loop-helix protein 41 [Sphaerodactylus townsendi]
MCRGLAPAAASFRAQPETPASMEEGIPRVQERPGLEHHQDFLGLDYPSLYMCKPKRGMKREDSKETYKLPHRLIEKKRRDRINECIAQLKDLLPEHLKLTTLGHLEKAVVLELTLKHLKALTALTEQQHQKIIALQNGERSLKSPLQSELDAFHSGFQTCTKEVLQYLSKFESWTPWEQRCAQLISHLHAVCTRFLPSPQLLTPKVCGKGPTSSTSSASPGQQEQAGPKLESQPNCVPVIQRTQNCSSNTPQHSSGELGENDTDTDSGYGGEGEGRSEGEKSQSRMAVKQEPSVDEAAPVAKRLKLDHHSSNSSPPSGMPSPEQAVAALLRPDPALLSSLMSFGALGAGGGRSGGGPFGQQPAAPFCLPFYFISPSAAAAYMQPFLDKSNLEKYLYPASTAPIPLIYPGIPAQAAVAAAAAATFPCLSSVLAPAEKANSSSSSSSSSTLLSPEVASPAQFLPHPFACSLGALSVDTDLPSLEQPLLSGKETP